MEKYISITLFRLQAALKGLLRDWLSLRASLRTYCFIQGLCLTKLSQSIIFKFQNKMGKKLTNQGSGTNQSRHIEKVCWKPQNYLNIDEYTLQRPDSKNYIETNRPLEKNNLTKVQIRKKRKSRTYDPDNKFLAGHVKKYYLFPFYYSTLFPFFKISWQSWKPNSVFKKMAHFLSSIPGLPSKKPHQCKSFDQRMKDQNYCSQPRHQRVDLLKAAITHLKSQQLDQNDKEVIQKYINKMREKSSYINFLQGDKMDDKIPEESESKKESEPFIPYQKKQETSIQSNNVDVELIFNEFLDIQK